MSRSGSVITEDVPADALAVGRGRQVDKPGWAAAFGAKRRAGKAACSRVDDGLARRLPLTVNRIT